MEKRKGFLILLILSIFLTGCMGQGRNLDSEKAITITVWHYYNGKQKEAFDTLLEQFNQTVGLDKGIVVTAESKGEVVHLEESIMASAEKKVGSEKLPDIFASYTDTAFKIHQMGLLADISQYMIKEEQEEYNPSFWQEGSITGEGLQILPVAKATELLYLNKTDWDVFAAQKGYDISQLSTWEGMREVAQVYYEWSGGKPFFGRDAAANFMLVGTHQLGADIFQKSGETVRVVLEEDVLRKIWDTYSQPYIEGYYGAFGRFRSDDLKTGDIVAAVGSTSSVAYYPKEVTLDDGSTYPIEVIVLPLPNFSDTTASGVQQGAGMAVVKSDTKKEQAAVEFLKWFTDEEQNVLFCVDTGYFPVKTSEDITGQMERAIESMEVSKEDLIYQNTILGLEVILNTKLYAPVPFKEGNSKRSIITRYLTDELETYKEDYSGIEVKDRQAFLEDCYKKWSSGLKKELEN